MGKRLKGRTLALCSWLSEVTSNIKHLISFFKSYLRRQSMCIIMSIHLVILNRLWFIKSSSEMYMSWHFPVWRVYWHESNQAGKSTDISTTSTRGLWEWITGKNIQLKKWGLWAEIASFLNLFLGPAPVVTIKWICNMIIIMATANTNNGNKHHSNSLLAS